jgi:hypothetical protein
MNASSCIVVGDRKLGCNEWWGGWGIYSPNHQLDCWWRLSDRWRTGQSGAHRTCPVPQPCHQFRWIPTVGAPDLWARLDVRCTPDKYCSLPGAPVWARLTSARAARALNAAQVAVGAEIAVAPLLHRTVRWIIAERLKWKPEAGEFLRRLSLGAPDTVRCTPDSPVNYSGVALEIPEGGEFELESSGAPDTVRWHTGQSGAPYQRCLRFAHALLLNPTLGLFIG